MSTYCLTPAADLDLDEIWRQVTETSGHRAADRLEDELHETMLRLAGVPGMGHLRDDLADEPLRFFAVHRYLIVYRPETEPLQVVRVLHGMRDVRSILSTSPGKP